MTNWLLIAAASQLLLGLSAVFDKLFLRRNLFNPWQYTFWLCLLSLFAFAVLPFGTVAISWPIFGAALLAGVLFGLGLLALYISLAKTEASLSLPAIAGFSALFAWFFSWPLLHTPIERGELGGFVLLLIGGAILFVIEERKARLRTALLALVSAALLGLSQVLSKFVFLESSFVAGFVWTKAGMVLLILPALLSPWLRKKIIFSESSRAAFVRRGVWYLGNRFLAAIGSLLFAVAVFLAHPALVQAMQGLQYVVIFVLGWALLRERFSGMVLWAKFAAVLFLILGVVWLTLHEYVKSLPPVDVNRPIVWGVTFSDEFSRELGLDWKKNLDAILTELRPARIRLIAYWDNSEPKQGILHFEDLDWQLGEAKKARIPVVVAVGLKTPRWPECHVPAWSNVLSSEERETALRAYLAKLIEHERAHREIIMWQVENEPYLPFGACKNRGNRFLEKEIELVKSLDPTRPVLTTDGGEFGMWTGAARLGDVFGTTMYRKVYPRLIGPVFGTIEYPLASSYFRLKERLVRLLIGDTKKKFIVSELQGEPWFPTHLAETPYNEEVTQFSPDYLRGVIAYAKQAGFEEYYLWGAEWWWWAKIKHGNSAYWDIAGQLFSSK